MTDFKNILKLSLLIMRILLTLLLLLTFSASYSQKDSLGILTGIVLDEKNNSLQHATVQLLSSDEVAVNKTITTDKDGNFSFESIVFGYYKLKITYAGLQTMILDSIHFRAERFDFNLNEIILKPNTAAMEEIIVYAEKPLIQTKDGNITFNAGESPLSAGSNASELLNNVPLVTKDPSGNVLVRGKEPRILIDDKPVELNLQQLQDMLESMPGSSIEKIEVLTNPPPQYANEQGGVINIVTKKGTVGMNGRISIYAGTRGEAGMNGSFSYRKKGLSITINTGFGRNRFEGAGSSRRQNTYPDSTNYFITESDYVNQNKRPNFRSNIVYDLNKYHSINLVLQYNGNSFDNENTTQYRNLNRFEQAYRISERAINSTGDNINPQLNLTYTLKTKKAGEMLRFFGAINHSSQENDRLFYQQFFNADYVPTGKDSTQQQLTNNKINGYNLRINYDVPLGKRTFLSLGSFYNKSRSEVEADAFYKRKTDGAWAELEALTNDFQFDQIITNFRTSLKQVLSEKLSITAGMSAENTNINFNLYKYASDTANQYWTYLPFATLNHTWNNLLNLTFSYRKSIRRPGIGQLNPTIDFSDPYNIRFGNPGLEASTAHNFDLVMGRTKKSFYVNLGMGYNKVNDIFSLVRTLMPDGKTEITWQNSSGRKEYEVSTWSGYTISKRSKINASASYTFNRYSDFDKEVRKFRDGGSLTSNVNTTFNWNNIYNATGSFTYNRFANPQGTARSTLSMNIALQAKMLEKKLTVTVNIIDPFIQQKARSFTYGSNFSLENTSTTQTRNFRLSLAYQLSKTQRKIKA